MVRELVPQIVKELISKSNGNEMLIFSKSFTKLLSFIGEGKVTKQLSHFFFFKAELSALVKIDGGLRPLTIGNTLRRNASKYALSKALTERQFFSEVSK